MSKIVLYPANGYDFDAADVAAYLSGLTSGVFSSDEDFPVTAAGGLNVTVGAGRGWVHPSRFTGYSITKREADTLTLPLADQSLPRIDRIVMRYDAGARAARLQVLQGTASSTPTAPAISRTELIYDLCLAQITRPAGSTTITTGQITDTRLDESLCGIVRDGVTNIPTDQLLKSAKERINALEEKATASAEKAAASQTAAAQSEANAAASEENSKTSEQAAAGSASTAKEQADKATENADTAAEQAATATTKAGEAAASATQADASQKKAAENQQAAEAAADRAAAIVSTDKTLSVDGAPADAKKTGDALSDRYTKDETKELLGKKLDLTGGTLTGPLILADGYNAYGIPSNAAAHNAAPPRFKNLGSSASSDMLAAIKAGTFDDIFVGDYFMVGDNPIYIGGLDWYLNCGDTNCTEHHALLVPGNNLYDYHMNATNTTAGGYVGSDMYVNGLTQAKKFFNNAFGEAHILKHRQYLVNAVTNGAPTGTDWYDSTVELMNENMVYGGRQFSPMPDGATDPWNTCRNYTIDKSQLPLFHLAPWLICNRNWYWLRDVVSAVYFAGVDSGGGSSCNNSVAIIGVRPVVGLIG